MGRQDLTIQVANISPTVVLSDLNTFFSYCGTVDNIHLRKTKDKTQSALVRFRQPYAFETALLLNGATFAGQPIRILPSDSEDIDIPITTPKKSIHQTQKDEERDRFPSMQAVLQDAASKGIIFLHRAKDGIEENLKLSEKGKTIVERTTLAINDYVSSGTAWLSGAVDKASKHVSAIGTNKRDNPNSRKQK